MKSNYYTLIKFFILGVLISEVFFIVGLTLKSFYNLSLQSDKLYVFFSMILLYLFIAYLSLREDKKFSKVTSMLKSRRFDLLIVFIAGAITLIIIDGLGTDYIENMIKKIELSHLQIFLFIPIVLFIANNLKKRQDKYKEKAEEESGFLSDVEIITSEEDAFNFTKSAEKFSESVFNYGSYESLVFGIDAPWGTGKSTFINLCQDIWDKKYEEKVIVYKFDVMKFESDENILNKFVDGLIQVIRSNLFAPELETMFAKYLKLLNDSKTNFSIFGVRFGIPSDNLSIDKAFEKLEHFLKGLDRKIIIIVDDLDRLNFSSVKEVLFVIKKSFILPNMSYILCYDTENISIFENQKLDAEKTIEFLEKFINIKYSLFIDSALLLNYFINYKDKVASRINLKNPDLISVASEGLKDIFNSKELDQYAPFVGNARKIKRLVNTILLLEVDRVDFTVMDFNKYDLIHLIIIYVNYPNIFRKIYHAETGGGFGFFSVVTKYDDYYPKKGDTSSSDYKNSTRYTDYVESLNANQKFILDKVFDADVRLNKNRFSRLSNEASFSYACFNKDYRNLNRYLDLIVHSTITSENNHYKYYVSLKNDLLKEEANFSVLLKNYPLFDPEFKSKQLWSIIVNEPYYNFTPEKVKEIINSLLDLLPKYSVVEIDSISEGLRNFIFPYFIAKLLNDFGWFKEKVDLKRETRNDNHRIAEWVFGKKDFSGMGILDTLSQPGRGVLGIYDLMSFRSNCSSRDKGSLYVLSRSLSMYENNNNPSEGIVKDIIISELRGVSQAIFKIFKEKYIKESKNVIEEVFNLSAKEIFGEEYNYIYSNSNKGDLDAHIVSIKSIIVHYILYNLVSKEDSEEIGCGFYDESGYNDQGNIYNMIIEYLYEVCFKPSIHGYNYFLFVLIAFSNMSREAYPKKGFLELLNRGQLKEYWKANESSILEMELSKENKILLNLYEMTFTGDIKDLQVIKSIMAF
ncbi:P-loop NTPase fold protein [Paenibacillus sp. 2TAF8]|uniref:KAP family P-loop NTPase fold protein n=1 Tax=Paenibacillus sp. 2TAF8 TaxID=3233020 RepID=UPI003F9E02D0